MHKDFIEIMKGKLIKNQKDFTFKPEEGPEISISSLSSGQKEILPIAVILSNLIKNKEPYFLIIEERKLIYGLQIN